MNGRLRKKITGTTDDNRLKSEKAHNGLYTKFGFVDEGYWLRKAMEGADVGRTLKRPMGDGVNNILIIDTSASMIGEGIQQARLVFRYIIEEFESTPFPDWKENIAVITFGHQTKILHHLTCSYENLKNCLDNIICGGPSPLLAGLMLSLGIFSCDRVQTKIYTYSRGQILPRIVVISDGNATDSFHMDVPEHLRTRNNENISVLSSLFEFAEKLQHRIFCVPVGNANMRVLESFAAVSKGQVVKIQNVRQQIGRFYPNFSLSSEIYCENKSLDWKRLSIEDIQRKLAVRPSRLIDRTDDDFESIRCILQHHREYVHRSDDESNNSGDEKSDDSDDENPDMPPLGSRVRRGPDWRWGNQGDCGVGTVTGHYKTGWLRVVWDNGESFPYRFGARNAVDIEIVEEPLVHKDNHVLRVGCLVTRGPDWEWGDQDGGKGCVGTVYLTHNQEVYVRWPNGHRGNYRFSYDGKFDVQICDGKISEIQSTKIKQNSELQEEKHPKFQSSKPNSKDSSEHQIQKEVNGSFLWQWQNRNGEWISHSREANDAIETQYRKERSSTVLVTVDDKRLAQTIEHRGRRNAGPSLQTSTNPEGRGRLCGHTDETGRRAATHSISTADVQTDPRTTQRLEGPVRGQDTQDQ